MSTGPASLFPKFTAWADEILAGPIPSDVIAFSINLYQGLTTFDVQISGAATFDPKDQAWAVNPIFSSGENLFSIPRELLADRWEEALDLVLGWARQYLSQNKGAAVLRSSRAIAVGFVDGDLHLVWPVAAA